MIVSSCLIVTIFGREQKRVQWFVYFFYSISCLSNHTKSKRNLILEPPSRIELLTSKLRIWHSTN